MNGAGVNGVGVNGAGIRRRDAFRAAGVAAAVALAAGPARASFVDAPDIVLFCDPVLAAPIGRVGALFRARTGAPLRIIAAPDAIFAAQLRRGERNDLVVATLPVADALSRDGTAVPRPELGRWRVRLAVARLGPGPSPAPVARLPELLGARRLGIVDASPFALVDGAALLARLGLADVLAARLAGEVDTGTIAWRLARDEIGLGTLFATDMAGGPYAVAADIPDGAYDPVRFGVLANRHVLSRNAEPFLAFLASPEARAVLTSSGLELDT